MLQNQTASTNTVLLKSHNPLFDEFNATDIILLLIKCHCQSPNIKFEFRFFGTSFKIYDDIESSAKSYNKFPHFLAGRNQRL
jgi:hypothetical protein